MEALVQGQPVPGLHPTPELEGGERDERHATANKQQADEEMAQGEEFVQQFHTGGLRAPSTAAATTYRPRPTRCTNPYRSIPRHVSAKLRSTPRRVRISAGV